MGLGNSVQKLFYLPEAHTDFVFAILAEELGLVGALSTVAVMTYLIWRGLLIGRRAELGDRPFAAYFTYGLVLLIALQILINLGVNIGGTSHRFNPSVIELRRQLTGHDCGQPWRDREN